MTTHEHYTIHKIESDGSLARGMYTVADAYATPELARELGLKQLRCSDGQRLALTRVETYDYVSSRGEPGRGLIRETILELLT